MHAVSTMQRVSCVRLSSPLVVLLSLLQIGCMHAEGLRKPWQIKTPSSKAFQAGLRRRLSRALPAPMLQKGISQDDQSHCTMTITLTLKSAMLGEKSHGVAEQCRAQLG